MQCGASPRRHRGTELDGEFWTRLQDLPDAVKGWIVGILDDAKQGGAQSSRQAVCGGVWTLPQETRDGRPWCHLGEVLV